MGREELAGLQRLKRHGLYFNRAYTAATQCSPSRALMMTGRFAPINRVTRTFLWPGLVHQNRQPNIAALLKEKAGYEVVWKGKWHLSYASNAAIGNGGEDWTEADIKAMEENYGWSGWNPPDAGNAIEQWQPTEFGKFDGMATLGGANPDNDGRYIEGRNPAGPVRPRALARAWSSTSGIARLSWTGRFACSSRWSIRTTFTSIRICGRWPATSSKLSPISVSAAAQLCRRSVD